MKKRPNPLDAITVESVMESVAKQMQQLQQETSSTLLTPPRPTTLENIAQNIRTMLGGKRQTSPPETSLPTPEVVPLVTPQQKRVRKISPEKKDIMQMTPELTPLIVRNIMPEKKEISMATPPPPVAETRRIIPSRYLEQEDDSGEDIEKEEAISEDEEEDDEDEDEDEDEEEDDEEEDETLLSKGYYIVSSDCIPFTNEEGASVLDEYKHIMNTLRQTQTQKMVNGLPVDNYHGWIGSIGMSGAHAAVIDRVGKMMAAFYDNPTESEFIKALETDGSMLVQTSFLSSIEPFYYCNGDRTVENRQSKSNIPFPVPYIDDTGYNSAIAHVFVEFCRHGPGESSKPSKLEIFTNNNIVSSVYNDSEVEMRKRRFWYDTDAPIQQIKHKVPKTEILLDKACNVVILPKEALYRYINVSNKESVCFFMTMHLAKKVNIMNAMLLESAFMLGMCTLPSLKPIDPELYFNTKEIYSNDREFEQLTSAMRAKQRISDYKRNVSIIKHPFRTDAEKKYALVFGTGMHLIPTDTTDASTNTYDIKKTENSLKVAVKRIKDDDTNLDNITRAYDNLINSSDGKMSKPTSFANYYMKIPSDKKDSRTELDNTIKKIMHLETLKKLAQEAIENWDSPYANFFRGRVIQYNSLVVKYETERLAAKESRKEAFQNVATNQEIIDVERRTLRKKVLNARVYSIAFAFAKLANFFAKSTNLYFPYDKYTSLPVAFIDKNVVQQLIKCSDVEHVLPYEFADEEEELEEEDVALMPAEISYVTDVVIPTMAAIVVKPADDPVDTAETRLAKEAVFKQKIIDTTDKKEKLLTDITSSPTKKHILRAYFNHIVGMQQQAEYLRSVLNDKLVDIYISLKHAILRVNDNKDLLDTRDEVLRFFENNETLTPSYDDDNFIRKYEKLREEYENYTTYKMLSQVVFRPYNVEIYNRRKYPKNNIPPNDTILFPMLSPPISIRVTDNQNITQLPMSMNNIQPYIDDAFSIKNYTSVDKESPFTNTMRKLVDYIYEPISRLEASITDVKFFMQNLMASVEDVRKKDQRDLVTKDDIKNNWLFVMASLKTTDTHKYESLYKKYVESVSDNYDWFSVMMSSFLVCLQYINDIALHSDIDTIQRKIEQIAQPSYKSQYDSKTIELTVMNKIIDEYARLQKAVQIVFNVFEDPAIVQKIRAFKMLSAQSKLVQDMIEEITKVINENIIQFEISDDNKLIDPRVVLKQEQKRTERDIMSRFAMEHFVEQEMKEQYVYVNKGHAFDETTMGYLKRLLNIVVSIKPNTDTESSSSSLSSAQSIV